MVATLHSVVGLAAVLTSIASVMAGPSHADTLHLITAHLGELIGGVFFFWIRRSVLEVGQENVF